MRFIVETESPVGTEGLHEILQSGVAEEYGDVSAVVFYVTSID